MARGQEAGRLRILGVAPADGEVALLLSTQQRLLPGLIEIAAEIAVDVRRDGIGHGTMLPRALGMAPGMPGRAGLMPTADQAKGAPRRFCPRLPSATLYPGC